MSRRRWFVLLLAIVVLATLVVALLVLWKSSREEIIACANYDSQVWAQSVYDTDPTRYAALDPDGNGLACEELPLGVAPALWTNEVPRGAEPAALISVSDGDTIRVDVGGQVETVRLILIDTPETRDPNNPPECYGAEATAFLEGLLPPGVSCIWKRMSPSATASVASCATSGLTVATRSIWSTRRWFALAMPPNRPFRLT